VSMVNILVAGDLYLGGRSEQMFRDGQGTDIWKILLQKPLNRIFA